MACSVAVGGDAFVTPLSPQSLRTTSHWRHFSRWAKLLALQRPHSQSGSWAPPLPPPPPCGGGG
eukprot:4685151-Pyramimonas_sp.AAC.1